MSKDEPIKKHQFKKGQSGNPKGRPKGVRNRSTVAKEILNLISEGTNPITREQQDMSQEHLLYFALLKKARQGDVAASKAILDSAYGQPKETVDVSTDAPTVDFRTLFNFKKNESES